MPAVPPAVARTPVLYGYREHRRRTLLVVDLRAYTRRRGQWLILDRVYVGGRWTPFVWARWRAPRASDGATEI